MMATSQDLIIKNATVLTMDPEKPTAEAVVTKGNKISFVGSNSEAEAWKTDNSRIIDGKGRTLIPGIIDSHFHVLGGSLQLGSAQLGEVTSLDQLTATLRDFAAENPQDEWVTGTRIGYSLSPGNVRLNRHHLDDIISNRPIILISYDFHIAWANTLALKMADLLYGAELGLEGEVVMGEDGLADGELREGAAYAPVLNLTEVYSGLWGYARSTDDEESEVKVTERASNLIAEGLQAASALGITSIHNMDGEPRQVGIYASLEAADQLPVRIYFPFSVRPDSTKDDLETARRMKETYPGNLVRCGSAKFFMDGVIEAWTGLMLEDYANKPGYRGESLWDFEEFSSRVTEYDQAGFQIITHAIGDGGVRRTLDSYETARAENGSRDSRHRIEHIELLHRDDLNRFSDLGVIASMQPIHAPNPVLWPAIIWPDCVPEYRWKDSFIWQDIRDTGATLVFGSDWPVAPQNPWWGLTAAVKGQSWAPGAPDQRQSLEDALTSYTRDAAYAEFQEDVKGRLKEGMLADLVLVSEDLESLPVEEIGNVRPLLTVCDGKITYEA
jgi:predicted amidohydrolase YtcJ